MSWRIVLGLLGVVLAAAPTPDSRQAVWSELGQPPVVDVAKGVVGWRFKDPTEAYSASLAASREKPLQIGNYLILCQGRCPKDVATMVPKLPQLTQGALPVLRGYLPEKHLLPNTSRYILNEQQLAAAAPQIPASAAAFQFGTEAVLGRYKLGKSEETLAILNYPTPQIARAQLPEFQKIPDALAKRSGPLVGIVLHAPDPAAADQLLSEIEYAASISWDQQPPLIIRPQTAAQIVLGGLELAGIILVFCFLSGLAYAGIRILSQRFGHTGAQDQMIVLGIGNK